ncbi:baeRF3 domain-containing protein [Parvularcula lutaonensis]|uniref:Uncharacterized protein n=1 Tax=Parvularcula lutaonensis TaxID=491923 RepID=A0ABV7MA18_9PROT|nr:hypothetical protein [Parvularcula lutaonensis]GGY36070.1 hypothetical protein GCM10007148_00210 [Parvularcula lutaonensis]
MKSSKTTELLEKIKGFLPEPDSEGKLAKDRVLSLLYPTPDFDGDHEKFEIVKRNLLSRLEDADAGPEVMRGAIREIVASLGQADLPPGGFAIFTTGEETTFVELSKRPQPRLQLGTSALALPVLADAATSHRFWIAVLDVEQPMLLHVVDGIVKDKTPREVMTLSDALKQCEPMDDIVWHSASSVRRSGAQPIYHALGVAADDLRKDEIRQVLTAFGKQVADIVRGDDPLILAGDPARIGAFKEHFSHRNLLDEGIQAAGEALKQDELLERAFSLMDERQAALDHETVSELDTSNALRGSDELRRAAIEGRIDTILLHPDHAGFLPGDDERLSLPEDADEAFATRSEAVSYTVRHGGRLILTREHTADGPIAITRYD